MASSRTRQGNKWLEAQPIEQNKEPEQNLWIAVLAKAFDDAFYCTDTSSLSKIQLNKATLVYVKESIFDW